MFPPSIPSVCPSIRRSLHRSRFASFSRFLRSLIPPPPTGPVVAVRSLLFDYLCFCLRDECWFLFFRHVAPSFAGEAQPNRLLARPVSTGNANKRKASVRIWRNIWPEYDTAFQCRLEVTSPVLFGRNRGCCLQKKECGRPNMASVSLPAPQHQWPNSSQLHPHHAYGYSQPAISRPARLPNPPFTFPAQDPEPTQPDSSMTPPEARSLPAFSFPQAPQPASPDSPSTATTSPQRANGHRRRGSELAGGEGTTTAEVNSDSAPAVPAVPSSPSLLPEPGPGLSGQSPGRRRHRHQRSSAISSVDLSAVAKAFPPASAAGGSAPVTPADMKQQHTLNDENAKLTSKTFPTTSPRSPPPPPSPGPPGDTMPVPSPASPPTDTGPACPSPLLTASSECTPSTLHPPHTPTEDSSPRSEPSQQASRTVRPKTAGEMMGLTGNRLSNFAGNEWHKRPLSFSASASKPATPNAPTDVPDVPPLPSTVTDATVRNDSSGKRDKSCGSVQETKRSEPPTQPDAEDKPPGKKKKVRSWAGMLTRKARRRTRKKPARKTPTPPPILSRSNSEVGSTSGVDFDKDNTVVIRSPVLPKASPAPPHQASADDHPTLESSWKPQSFYEQGQESDVFSPVIDLDAALGPFNTPDMVSEAPEASGFSVATKRMYSGGRRGQFVGPEMRYHRRTESAPVMPPFDRPTSGSNRMSGMPTMANPDVFDEEEEDAFLAGNDSPPLSGDAASQQDVGDNDSEAGLGIQFVDSADGPSSADTPAAGSTLSSPKTIVADDSDSVTPNDDTCGDSERIPSSHDSLEVVYMHQRHEVTPNVKNSPPLATQNRPATSPDCQNSKCGFAPETPNASVPSDSEEISLEVPRLATASSSMTGRQTWNSNNIGEPGKDCTHGSTEDVPSLTSTTSTATGTTPRMSFNFTRATGDQSHPSASATAPPPRSPRFSSKRASLVSLTKLVGGSLGPEKSKLSYEEKAPDEEEPVKTTKRKTPRFSRLMHFWKDKEKYKEKARPKGS